MEVRLINIENFGNIKSFKAAPCKGISIVKDRFAKDAMLALAGVLSYPTAELGDFNARQRPGFHISLQVDDISECDRLNSINRISGCKEALRCRIFLNDKKQNYSKRLMFYKKCDDYYDKAAFDEETDYLGHMQVFRSALRTFIADFSPIVLSNNKNMCVKMLPSGEFIVEMKKLLTCDVTCSLSEQERILFEYVCFLEVNRFWNEIIEIRSLDFPKMPLLATNFIEYFDTDESFKSPDVKNIIDYAKMTGLQFIIFCDSNCVPEYLIHPS